MSIPQPEDAQARLVAGFRAGDAERTHGPAATVRFDVGRLLRKLTDLTLVRPAAYMVRRLGFRQDVITRVKFLAAEDSAHYVLDKMMPCAIFDNRYALFDLAIRNALPQGLLLEFGVFNGKSINYVSKRIGGRHIFGFDSFEGLAEDWGGTGLLKGAFDVRGRMPKVGRNVTLVRGWFQDTVPVFLKEHPGPIAFANLDADTYEATAYVLGEIADRLAVGTVLQFDEYLGYPGWRTGEYLAFANFCRERGLRYKYLGVGWMSVAVQITALRS